MKGHVAAISINRTAKINNQTLLRFLLMFVRFLFSLFSGLFIHLAVVIALRFTRMPSARPLAQTILFKLYSTPMFTRFLPQFFLVYIFRGWSERRNIFDLLAIIKCLPSMILVFCDYLINLLLVLLRYFHLIFETWWIMKWVCSGILRN